MAHGTPDWGYARSEIFVLSDDLAELAARLLSIHVFDRRGNVIWSDDFRDGMGAWKSTATGTGAEVALETTYPKWPPFCVKLTGGSGDGLLASIERYLSNWGANAFGLEISVAFTTTFDLFELTMFYYDGTESKQARIQLDDDDDKIYYLGSAGSNVELDDLVVRKSTTPNYNCLKLVADFSTEKYVRFMFNGTEYDMSTYDLYVSASEAAGSIHTRLRFWSRSGQNDYCLVDGVIVTQNEE